MEIVEIEEKAEYIKELFEKEKYDSFYLYEACLLYTSPSPRD